MQILEALVLHDESALYALICRAWLTITERNAFAHLKVTRSRLAGFSDIGYRPRHLVEHIWFSIETSEQHCRIAEAWGFIIGITLLPKLTRKAIQDLVIG